MKLIELKLKDGKPLYVVDGQISYFHESSDNSNYTEIMIDGQKLFLGQVVAEVKKRVEE